MGYQVAVTPSARRDLQEIVRYLSVDAPDRALAFGQKLVNSTRVLGQFPEMGRVVPEFKRPELREIVVHSYRVIHRVDHADLPGGRASLLARRSGPAQLLNGTGRFRTGGHASAERGKERFRCPLPK